MPAKDMGVIIYNNKNSELSVRLIQHLVIYDEILVDAIKCLLMLGQHLLIPCFLSPTRIIFTQLHW